MNKIVCTSCLTPYEEYDGNFHKAAANPSGHTSRCIECVSDVAGGKVHLVYERMEINIKKENTRLKRVGSITNATSKKYMTAMTNLKNKYYWSEERNEWLKSKERTAIMQYKLVCQS